MSAPSPLIRLHADDDVLIARRVIGLGESLPGFGVRMRAQVPAGHKIAAHPIAAGATVKKFDTVIGLALCDIEAGEHVHTHNMGIAATVVDPAFGADVRPVDYLPEAQRARFMGYVRPDGRVATRNFIGLLSSVNCSSTVIRHIAAHFTPQRLAAYPNIDGVVAFAQTSGCGMSSPSEHFDVLRRTLAGYARHPNLAGVLIVGLGCERNQVADFMTSQGLAVGPHVKTFVMQEAGGTRATIAAGIAAVEAMLPSANDVKREPVSAAHLKIGLECGGSDGFSGISANPALGAAMDILVRHGGTAILSETPEIHGVEHKLTRRAVSPEVGRKLLERLAWWTEYTRGHNGQFNGVVGPGNQAGGLANIVEKSLGSAMKAGSTPMRAVYEYAEPITENGFV
jgi:altronate hydrolase